MRHVRIASVGGVACQVLSIPSSIRTKPQAERFIANNPVMSWDGRIAVSGSSDQIRHQVIALLGFRGKFSEILERIGKSYIVWCSHRYPVGKRFKITEF